MSNVVPLHKIEIGRVDSMLDSFVLSLRAANKSEKTVVSYTEAVRQFTKYLRASDLPLLAAGITRTDVEGFIADQLARFKPATAANRFRSLQQFFKWLQMDGEIEASPMRNMRVPKVPDNPPPILTLEDLKALLATCDRNKFLGRRDEAIRLFRQEPAQLRLPTFYSMELSSASGRSERLIVPMSKMGTGSITILSFGSGIRPASTASQRALSAATRASKAFHSAARPSGVARYLIAGVRSSGSTQNEAAKDIGGGSTQTQASAARAATGRVNNERVKVKMLRMLLTCGILRCMSTPILNVGRQRGARPPSLVASDRRFHFHRAPDLLCLARLVGLSGANQSQVGGRMMLHVTIGCSRVVTVLAKRTGAGSRAFAVSEKNPGPIQRARQR